MRAVCIEIRGVMENKGEFTLGLIVPDQDRLPVGVEKTQRTCAFSGHVAASWLLQQQQPCRPARR